MRRILFVISLFFLGQMVYCQTYSLTFEYVIPTNVSHSYSFALSGSNQGGIQSGSGKGSLTNNYKVIQFDNIVYNDSFTLYSRSVCGPDRDTDIYEDTSKINFIELLKEEKDLEASLECFSTRVTKFKPNITISNLEVNSPTEICAGNVLQLGAFPPGFPSSVYHWQYSTDNQVNWIDVPLIINGKTTNNVALTEMTLQELLGSNHLAYLNQTIFFRLGYNQNTSFTNPLAITYSPCAPIITSVNYVGPNCNNESIQKLEVTFNRPLDSTKGENLNQLYVKETVNNISPIKETPMLYLENISYPSSTKTYAYSNIASLGPLESGREYEIVYQAQITDPLDSSKKILKGFMTSINKFKYINPVALSFKLQNPKNPSCFGASDGSVEVLITSGIPKNFELNGKPATTVKISDTLYRIDGLGANELGHKIKVTDANDCIDTNAND